MRVHHQLPAEPAATVLAGHLAGSRLPRVGDGSPGTATGEGEMHEAKGQMRFGVWPLGVATGGTSVANGRRHRLSTLSLTELSSYGVYAGPGSSVS